MKQRKTVLFHGSDHVVEQPKYGIGKPYNDYGQGFYCTLVGDMAREWAVGRGTDGFLNEYSLNMDNMKILDLSSDDYSLLNWMAILVANRQFDLNTPLAVTSYEFLADHFGVDTKPFDIIVGYRADDSYFTFAKAFLDGRLSYQGLSRAMKLGDLGIQVVLKSSRAFDAIHFEKSEPVDANVWYPRRAARDNKARRQYVELAQRGYQAGDIYMVDLIRGEIEVDDARLR